MDNIYTFSTKNEHSYIHVEGFRYFITNYFTEWNIKHLKNVSGDHIKNLDFYGVLCNNRNGKEINIRGEGKFETHDIEKTIEKENVVFEIIGSINANLYDFSKYGYKGKRIDSRHKDFNSLKSDIQNVMTDKDLISKFTRGYAFSEFNNPNTKYIFSYYFEKYKTFVYFWGQGVKESIFDIMKNYSDKIYLQISPNTHDERKGVQWNTVNIMIPLYLLMDKKCFLKKFKMENN